MANPNNTTTDPWVNVKRLDYVVWPESEYSTAYVEFVESSMGNYYDAYAVDDARCEDAKTIAELHAKLRDAEEEMNHLYEELADVEGERDELQCELDSLFL